jgi:hypothetical protein
MVMLVPHPVFKIKCNKFAMMTTQSTLRYDDTPTEMFWAQYNNNNNNKY